MFNFWRGARSRHEKRLLKVIEKLRAQLRDTEAEAVSYKKQKERVQTVLNKLREHERMMDEVVASQLSQIEEMRDVIDRNKDEYDRIMSEATVTIDKYDKQVDSLRDIIKVNEKTIEAQDAAINRLRQHWKAETAIEVLKEQWGDKGPSL